MTQLLVAPCSHEAAKFAVMNWHYSQAMPAGKIVAYGVWEDKSFVGAVLYGHGANNKLGKPYGLDMTECVELVRIAMTNHKTTVSQVVAKTFQLLKASNPRIRLIVSFADPEQSHHGGIYQAGNWIYAGASAVADEYIVNGQRMHGRSVRARRNSSGTSRELNTLAWLHKHVDPNATRIDGSSKHRYLYPLDRAMRRKIQPLALPYPRGSSLKGETLTVPVRGSGSIPESRSIATATDHD